MIIAARNEQHNIKNLIDAINSASPIKKKSITVPKYQRSLVWAEKMRKAFENLTGSLQSNLA